MRSEYAADELTETRGGADPFGLFEAWFSDAIAAGIPEPNAMAVATATPDGRPSVRFVLLKGLDREGAVFFTNFDSRKGAELKQNPRAAAVFSWFPMQRQVRIEGHVTQVADAEADEYFSSRPQSAQTSAWASPQSRVVADRAELLERWRLAADRPVDAGRPPFWGGFRIEIETWEFWQGRPDRLHDRLRFSQTDAGWVRERLAP